MLKRFLFLVVLIEAVSLATTAQELTAREYAKAHGMPNRASAITLIPPQACTLSKQHPCVYYGGDIDPNDPQLNALSNENSLFIPNSFTYTEVNVPVMTTIHGSFSNNIATYGVIDPITATWFYRTGVSEGNGGTQICSGDTPATFTATGKITFGNEYQLLTQTLCVVPTGNVWFAVTPNCTNPNDPDCRNGRYFESDTDGKLNAINGRYTVTSNNGMGPTFNSHSQYFDYTFASWCNDLGVACGDGMSAGVLK